MPQILGDLTIDEVSLVDSPANAEIDPKTGKTIRRAVIALYKRDSGENQFHNQSNSTATAVQKGRKKMQDALDNFVTVLKSARTRDQIAAAVAKLAKETVGKRGGSLERTEARIWAENPEVTMAYEAAPVGVAQYQPKMAEFTAAEVELDSRARKIMKRSGIGYPQACSQVLTDDPALYKRYERELAAGATVEIPEPPYNGGVSKRDAANTRSASKTKQSQGAENAGPDGEDGGECPECGEDVDDGDQYCASCGEELPERKKTKAMKAKR